MCTSWSSVATEWIVTNLDASDSLSSSHSPPAAPQEQIDCISCVVSSNTEIEMSIRQSYP